MVDVDRQDCPTMQGRLEMTRGNENSVDLFRPIAAGHAEVHPQGSPIRQRHWEATLGNENSCTLGNLQLPSIHWNNFFLESMIFLRLNTFVMW